MQPPYTITNNILKMVSSISEKIGEVNTAFLVKSNPILRKQNQIKTIHSSLSIEGNTLTEKQITAIVENKRVIGPEKDITEVINALDVYTKLSTFKYYSEKDFLKAHKILMKNLVKTAGKYRTDSVGIVKGSNIQHIAPPHQNVPFLMKNLFEYVKDKNEISLIKSCVFHYEMEFIHPFMDGNGRMGRLWQTVILMKEYPFFEFLPFETLISKNQSDYYKALSDADKEGNSTKFIEYMLTVIDESLNELLDNSAKSLSVLERLSIFLENSPTSFTRKTYMNYFKNISSATASRDLKKAVEIKLIQKSGNKNTSEYTRL